MRAPGLKGGQEIGRGGTERVRASEGASESERANGRGSGRGGRMEGEEREGGREKEGRRRKRLSEREGERGRGRGREGKRDRGRKRARGGWDGGREGGRMRDGGQVGTLTGPASATRAHGHVLTRLTTCLPEPHPAGACLSCLDLPATESLNSNSLKRVKRV